MGRSRVVEDLCRFRSVVGILPLFRDVLLSYYHPASAASVKASARYPALQPGSEQKHRHPFKRFKLHHKQGIDVNNYLGGGGSRGWSRGLQQLPREPVQDGW
jgi:hypothetical protein